MGNVQLVPPTEVPAGAIEAAVVQFIDENGAGAGVRLSKPGK
jgi:hypothetical protein